MSRLEYLVPISISIAVVIVLFLFPSFSVAAIVAKGLLASALAAIAWATGLLLYLWYLESK